MSRIGKLPINIPDGVECTQKDGSMSVKGPKGLVTVHVPKGVIITQDAANKTITVNVSNQEDGKERALWGLARQLVANAAVGVVTPFQRSLEFVGVGFKVEIQGRNVKMDVGFSHSVIFELPEGVDGSVEKNVLTLTSVDKQLVGETAARIRKIRKPEPYKGKGIKYTDEVVRRKAGKTAGK
ncbi:MAG: 50S ribosomal protein L6 [Patescibacteria group bacterium]|nr:50S ribosomal protein L6 [Patescibacteria group bacterium]